jgi:hypothetical protein
MQTPFIVTNTRDNIKMDPRNIVYILVLWHVDSLLGNDFEVSDDTTAVAK